MIPINQDFQLLILLYNHFCPHLYTYYSKGLKGSDQSSLNIKAIKLN